MVRFGVLKESAPRAASPYREKSGPFGERSLPSLRPPGDYKKRREARLTGLTPSSIPVCALLAIK